MKQIKNKLYLIAGTIFIIIGLLTLVLDKNKSAFIGVLSVSLLCFVFNFIFKVKWNAIAKESLFNACEEIKSFGSALPLRILGKLQIVWIILLTLSFFKPLCIILFPEIPTVIFTILGNIAFSFFLFGTFYQLFQGNLKGISLTTGIFAIYNILDVILSYMTESHIVSTRSMCLFLVFWSIHRIFSIMLLDEEPEEEVKVKAPKVKKEKKSKKKESEINENSKEAVEAFIENQKEESKEDS